MIPDWNVHGVLPPLDLTDPVGPYRSPYVVTPLDLVLHFSTSDQRRRILSGWLDFRQRLNTAGLSLGFQWIDGSFVENVEHVEDRPPGDVDVVTFYQLPAGMTQRDVYQRASSLFDLDGVKQQHAVDAYFVRLDPTQPQTLVSQAAYWYSVWSHRRTGLWKGYVQVDLASAQDVEARKQLDADEQTETST